jgi:hypothetical protein
MEAGKRGVYKEGDKGTKEKGETRRESEEMDATLFRPVSPCSLYPLSLYRQLRSCRSFF